MTAELIMALEQLRAVQAQVEELRDVIYAEREPDVVYTTVGAWTGIIRVAGKKLSTGFLAGVSGTESKYVRIYFDGVTVPDFATKAEYEADAWGDEAIIVTTEQLYATYGDFNVDRA
jgi:hypothetical protein